MSSPCIGVGGGYPVLATSVLYMDVTEDVGEQGAVENIWTLDRRG
jgi:hypothetical protein